MVVYVDPSPGITANNNYKEEEGLARKLCNNFGVTGKQGNEIREMKNGKDKIN